MFLFDQFQINKVIDCAFEAGEIALKAQKLGDFKVMKKADNSSVTTADIAVSKFIDKELSQLFPQIPIICEEGMLREVDDIFWLIDPIDGTSSFINGSAEFATNIALVKNGKVVFGLIYAPSFEGGKMAVSTFDNKVILQNKNKENLLLENEKLISSSVLKIVTSAKSKESDIVKYLNQFYPQYLENYSVERLSSAIKFFRLIENNVDLYLHFRQSMEWDIASGQFLVELMGGKVKNLSSDENGFIIGCEMSYKKKDFINQSFISFIKNFD